MEATKVRFSSRGIAIVGNLFHPPSSAPDRRKAALVCGHQGTGVKEQAAGLYAQMLAKEGFVTLAFDAAYQGESEGQPRNLEDPYQRAEDFKNAVTYLSNLKDEVDAQRIGLVGVCASEGYGLFAAQTDLRIKGVAGVVAVCWGNLSRDGMRDGSGNIDMERLRASLTHAGQDRLLEAQGNPPGDFNILDSFSGPKEDIREYYANPLWKQDTCSNKQLTRSIDMLATYDSYHFIDWISPRPLLLIAGAEAATSFYSKKAFDMAKEPKELFLVPGKGHVDLYQDADVSEPKLVEFFAKALCA